MIEKHPIVLKAIESKIHLIRNEYVMLSSDLAELYAVETRILNEAVKRNIKRFPADFMFQLTDEEVATMVSQFAIPSRKYLGGYNPYAFTEQGIAMLSGVLNSDRAITINIEIMRVFVSFRRYLLTHKEILEKLAKIESKMELHDNKIETHACPPIFLEERGNKRYNWPDSKDDKSTNQTQKANRFQKRVIFHRNIRSCNFNISLFLLQLLLLLFPLYSSA
ncbi:MAG: hypothetical protein A2231_02485 [Candidatus Firestonebacteria bacterium RIFOXYA2_FULL_40_8]|nr:MAG: hypothetical protein A2231_02485 [Candidatus Firestonebacteria bacterium RIFOXYA2_FULL_40_8]